MGIYGSYVNLQHWSTFRSYVALHKKQD